MTSPFLSVIVCTYNRRDLLAGCLESIEGQDAPRDQFEVVVVDNHCTDDTRAVVQAYEARLPNLRYAYEPAVGLSHARNRGAVVARGTYLAYIDDDARLPPTYVTTVCRTLARHAPDILGGPIYPFYTTPKPAWFRDEYEIRHYETRSGFSRTCGISGSNFVIRREVLERLGGFDPALGMRGTEQHFGEDRKVLETYRRTTPVDQQRVYYDVDCIVLHHVPPQKMRLGYMLGRGFRAGRMNLLVTTEQDATPGSFLRLAASYPRAVYRLFAGELRKGLRHVDWVHIARTLAIHAGKLVAGGQLVTSRIALPLRNVLAPGRGRGPR